MNHKLPGDHTAAHVCLVIGLVIAAAAFATAILGGAA